MNAAPVKIIFETDMTYDVDDVGALAVLHALADAGKAELLAVSFNETHRSGAAAIAAINTWYGRGDIPIGTFGGDLHAPDPSRYLDHVAAFPHDLGHEATPDSLDLYRSVLGSQPDGAVTIVSVGFLNNLDVLLREEPRLVAAKVRQLVVMGGRHNDGFNLVRHNLVDVTQRVVTDWPTPLAITDFGGSVRTGAALQYASFENPVREAYFRYFGESFRGRSSWDQVAALYAVFGAGEWFEDVGEGEASLPNGHVWQVRAPHRIYVGPRKGIEEFQAWIEELMTRPPGELR
ncbi:MAG: hypothetical protein F4Y86_02905 [Gammaproteobacteria bacterium]|nr:hypothetical protein [Gammaproteobacteria bacterium]